MKWEQGSGDVAMRIAGTNIEIHYGPFSANPRALFVVVANGRSYRPEYLDAAESRAEKLHKDALR